MAAQGSALAQRSEQRPADRPIDCLAQGQPAGRPVPHLLAGQPAPCKTRREPQHPWRLLLLLLLSLLHPYWAALAARMLWMLSLLAILLTAQDDTWSKTH